MELYNNVKRYKAGISTTVQYVDPQDLDGLKHLLLDHIGRAHNIGADFLAKQGLNRSRIIWGN